jgi:LmbE family N-acetylglucosaminyl deacetylase
MFFADKSNQAAAGAAFAGLILAGVLSVRLACQQPVQQPARQPVPAALILASVSLPELSDVALPLPEDRGAAALEQALKRLTTTASLMIIVAHPDDEDGALLTYLSRGMGVRASLLTLTRGEGGQNAMGEESYDALGLIRTNELLKASEYYGAKQLWGTEADFGFSKTQEESFAKWGHDRVLYDAVLAVRRERPQVILSTFVGGVSDGHGHHQVSGEIAQEVFKAAGDPAVFPEQLKNGLQPWQPLAVYSRTPFAPIKDGKMFDYATGKWAPARFKNYVTGEWIEGAPSADVTIQVGTLDPILGRSYMQIAREGWGRQKSQNGGANPVLSGPAETSYHLWAVAPAARKRPADYTPLDKPLEIPKIDADLFHNRFVSIDTWIGGLPQLVKAPAPRWLVLGLAEIGGNLRDLLAERKGQEEIETAHKLAAIYRQTLDIRARVQVAPEAELDARSKASLLFELDLKIEQFQTALKELLGLDMIAFRTNSASAQGGGPFGGGSADEVSRSVSPGEEFLVRVHAAQATTETRLDRVWLDSRSGDSWKTENVNGAFDSSAPVSDPIFRVHAAENAEPTQPYFTRPNIEQPYYDLIHPEWRLRSFAPYPLSAWAEFTFDGLPVRIGEVVQTMARVPGVGGVYEPLVVTPAIGVRVEPESRILPLDGSALPVRVTVHTQAAAEGTVALELPAGWAAQPAEAKFHTTRAGDTEPFLFSVTPDGATTGAYNIEAVARSGGHDYKTGWQSVGYTGLRPYNQYKLAELKTSKVDVKLASGLRIGYVMGTGDLVPEAIEGLGGAAHLLTAAELASGDLSAWNVIVIGIRAYSVLPELAAAQPRLDEFVRRGGTLIVQYQTGNFPAPFPLSMSRMAERVVDETAPVKLLEPANPLLRWPNAIGNADFDGWVEERGHSFLDSWDAHYTALTETADPGQDAQRGGLLVMHPGKGTYIYVAYALYRQLPELVPGAYRLLANMLSAGQENAAHVDQTQAPHP